MTDIEKLERALNWTQRYATNPDELTVWQAAKALSLLKGLVESGTVVIKSSSGAKIDGATILENIERAANA